MVVTTCFNSPRCKFKNNAYPICSACVTDRLACTSYARLYLLSSQHMQQLNGQTLAEMRNRLLR